MLPTGPQDALVTREKGLRDNGDVRWSVRIVGVLMMSLLGACGSTRLDRPNSATPAAGICGLATGRAGNVTFNQDLVPTSPRCLVIHDNQRLSVTNNTNHPITATLGTHYKATVPPHKTHTFSAAVGIYLAPGVHRLVFTPYSAADIWVDAVCKGPGATDCSTP